MSSDDKISKIYDPSRVEKEWYDHWLDRGYFHAEVNSDRSPYTVVIPPPNVTGSLTIGHVLNNTIQDVLVRRARMQGRETCWIPGTDHASIATETKVTKMLAVKGTDKNEIGREEFLKCAWEWKNEYGSLIIQQLKRLGCSCDWERERFTMDNGYYRAVITAFVKLYDKGLIYRGKRLVNWCTATKSAISDEEVIYREVQGKLWYLKYLLSDSDDYVTVATTRPETMLGDTAVAVHPGDKRFKNFVGKSVMLPLAERKIPVIADDFVDPEFGTGCVKVTPAHDFNDFLIGKRHDLDFINILNPDGSLNESVPEQFRELDRFDARDKVVEALTKSGALEKTEDYTTSIGYSERGDVPVEPYLSEQWFMAMEKLAKPALEAVRKGDIKFNPSHWLKTYEHWMTNIQDWCISRQLWWGHRIPVWYCRGNDIGKCELDCKDPIVSVDEPESCPACGSKDLVQDPDVLDTWASSWLWPIGVHNWPEESPDLDYFHPTDDLVTGPDIIFFWVARMIMASLEFKGEIPFKNVYFTGMVRDMQGRKMSKSLGNSPDPLKLMDKYGADAVRYGIMLIAPQGQDILFSDERMEIGRNFMNKLWNVSRFLDMAGSDIDAKPVDELEGDNLDLSDRWILSRLNRTITGVDESFDAYRFNETAKKIYDFTWSDFCDWYVEVIKSRLYGDDVDQKKAAFSVANHVMRGILKMLHPFAPFITEEIWNRLEGTDKDETDLIVSHWPGVDDKWIDENVEGNFVEIQEVITGVRTVRAEMNVPPGMRADLLIRSDNGQSLKLNERLIRDLAKVDDLTIEPDVERPDKSATVVVGKKEMFIPLGDLIDVETEKKRLEEKIYSLDGRLSDVATKLNNQNFVNRAPKEVVERERKKLGDMKENLAKLKQNYTYLE
ncbi:MAG TPA: valine--tRNA ligase [Candidatus Marinimicrobia bacterium]|nr:valine--tRNA ligase [Candidatus Neomarinimicrobiota bacterium]HIB03874.1 valine--tRNA ligase [Candidatus Neomarinimicrobiota bacterium]HIB95946.1 valine--tRNA ligase [Candidatus Neomarinimicrobiota bacterium]HIN62698.1 valine--tRNA ligase [Candidatus Neomarinimicrobiota bacterium]HIO74278.1 valine--tRNA ligase [Candidatus Neomarinimicrobiota bacterium]